MAFSLISRDDFETLFTQLKRRGWKLLMNAVKANSLNRATVYWDSYESSGSNWWEIPAVRNRWNLKISGNSEVAWEDYVAEKYFHNKNNLKLLSVGCGTGTKERVFARYPQFSCITGIDISPQSIRKAIENADQDNLVHLQYRCGDFAKIDFPPEHFDVVLFYSSLHHFSNIESLIQRKVLSVLKPGGKVIIFEYTGPNRFQYTKEQLKAGNKALSMVPEYLRTRKNGPVKEKIYRPGWLRMWLNDPSEAPHSEEILPVLRKFMHVLEEKPVGGAILHSLLKGIAHNFNNKTPEATRQLEILSGLEDEFYEKSGQSDFWFGVYGRKEP